MAAFKLSPRPPAVTRLDTYRRVNTTVPQLAGERGPTHTPGDETPLSTLAASIFKPATFSTH